uniref:YqaJ viral recombinase domain-containing protein n=1 Tax=Clytia hemisphaerica TaxID=252671 RepID=A0A7M5U1J0_9CNID
IEQHTREQAKSNLWFEARAGVITASKFRQACHSDVSQSSKSLIMQICYPQMHKFTSNATTYGCDNEKVALSYLEVYLNHEHRDAKITESGLIRSSEFPFLGASPDGLLDCSCCKESYVIEIKCPIKCKEKSP